MDWGLGTEDIDAALAEADVVVEREVVNHRIAGAPIEPRGVLADYRAGELTLYTSTQVPHFVRLFLALQLGISEERIRVVAPDVGGGFGGTFSVKIGPTSANYRGTLKMQELDEAARRATMLANGSDKRGSGGAKATIVSTLHEAQGGGTRVEVVTGYCITGRLASFGRGGMIEDVGNRLLREFAGCLQERLQAERRRAARARR